MLLPPRQASAARLFLSCGLFFRERVIFWNTLAAVFDTNLQDNGMDRGMFLSSGYQRHGSSFSS